MLLNFKVCLLIYEIERKTERKIEWELTFFLQKCSNWLLQLNILMWKDGWMFGRFYQQVTK